MKILQIISHYIPATQFGGPQYVAHSLGKALVDCGHQVVVCTTNMADRTNDLDVPLDVPVDLDDVTVYYEDTVLSRYWGFSPGLYRRVGREIMWADVVLVHFHYQFANWAGAYLARQSGKPYVIFAHGSFNRWGIARKGRIKKHFYLRLFERANIEGATFIAFNAQEELDLSLYSHKGMVIPSGIDPIKLQALPERDFWRSERENLAGKIIFLYLGRLNPKQKGLDMLIPAFAQLLSCRSDAHLMLVGPDERGGRQEVSDHVTSFGIEQHVTFTGMVEGMKKWAILRDSDVFVLTSPSEGTSIALLEAMYMGLPAIVTNRVGLSNTIQMRQCGSVVQRDVTEIANAMHKLVENEEMRVDMGREAHRLVEEEFSWDTIVKQLIGEIEKRQ